LVHQLAEALAELGNTAVTLNFARPTPRFGRKPEFRVLSEGLQNRFFPLKSGRGGSELEEKVDPQIHGSEAAKKRV
jgi:hypothetical protein